MISIGSIISDENLKVTDKEFLMHANRKTCQLFKTGFWTQRRFQSPHMDFSLCGNFKNKSISLIMHSFARERHPKTNGESLVLSPSEGFSTKSISDSVALFQQPENQYKHGTWCPSLKIRVQGYNFSSNMLIELADKWFTWGSMIYLEEGKKHS